MPSNRVAVYVDGFNLYHALCDLNCEQLKWLDLWSLASDLLEQDQSLVCVKYFSAFAKWREASMRRHQRYVDALKSKGVTVVLGRFKKKQSRCRECGKAYTTHEEKETDVNIGAHLMADALKDRFDVALVVSADTDLNGAISLVRHESGKPVKIIAPPSRHNRNSKVNYAIPKTKIARNLLPATCAFEGRSIRRPSEYDPPGK